MGTLRCNDIRTSLETMNRSVRLAAKQHPGAISKSVALSHELDAAHRHLTNALHG